MIDHGMSLINDTLHISIPDAPKVNKVIYNGVEFVSGAQWIPVSERLPKQQQTVLIQDFGEITIGYLNAENRWKDLTNLDDDLKGVNAWMPLSNPYKEDKDDRSELS